MGSVAGNSGAPPLGELQVRAIPPNPRPRTLDASPNPRRPATDPPFIKSDSPVPSFPYPPLPIRHAVLRRLRGWQHRGRATRRGQRVRDQRSARHQQPASTALVLLQGAERAGRAEGLNPHRELLKDKVALSRRHVAARPDRIRPDVGADKPQERLLLQAEGPTDEEAGRFRPRKPGTRRRAGQPRGWRRRQENAVRPVHRLHVRTKRSALVLVQLPVRIYHAATPPGRARAQKTAVRQTRAALPNAAEQAVRRSDDRRGRQR